MYASTRSAAATGANRNTCCAVPARRAACGVWRRRGGARLRRRIAVCSEAGRGRTAATLRGAQGSSRATALSAPPLVSPSLLRTPPFFRTHAASWGGRGVPVDHDHARTRREAPPPPELTAPRGLEGSGQVLTAPIEPRYPARFHLSPHRSPVRGGRRQGQELTGDGAHWTSAVVFLFRSFFSFSFLFFFFLFRSLFSFSFSLFLFSVPSSSTHTQPTNQQPSEICNYVCCSPAESAARCESSPGAHSVVVAVELPPLPSPLRRHISYSQGGNNNSQPKCR